MTTEDLPETIHCVVCNAVLDTTETTTQRGDGKPNYIKEWGWFCHNDYGRLHALGTALLRERNRRYVEALHSSGQDNPATRVQDESEEVHCPIVH